MNCQNELRVINTFAAPFTPPRAGLVTIIIKCFNSTFHPHVIKLVPYPSLSKQEVPVQRSGGDLTDTWRGPFGLFLGLLVPSAQPSLKALGETSLLPERVLMSLSFPAATLGMSERAVSMRTSWPWWPPARRSRPSPP